MASFGSQVGPQNRLKSKENRVQEAFHLGLHFLIDFYYIFGLIFEGFLQPKWSQVGIKIESKINANF